MALTLINHKIKTGTFFFIKTGHYIYDREGRYGGKFFCVPHFGMHQAARKTVGVYYCDFSDSFILFAHSDDVVRLVEVH